MARNGQNAWMGLGLEMWTLGMESASVIGLRTMKLAQGGPAAGREAELMVSEKIATAFDVQMKLMTGGFGFIPAVAASKAVGEYATKVRANRKRLSR
ncbi:Antifreeze protein [Sphingomonas antarctica]|uniref:hypothetical protein n=1 Tax=Sphingomonas antarctica TaxID=2040274 RepID=UPI0039E9FD73